MAIIVLALGWRKGPHATTPPYFYGVLALLFGLLTMLLNNFQAGKLPPPARADQTVLVLCLLYTVFALQRPQAAAMGGSPTSARGSDSLYPCAAIEICRLTSGQLLQSRGDMDRLSRCVR